MEKYQYIKVRAIFENVSPIDTTSPGCGDDRRRFVCRMDKYESGSSW